MTKSNGQTEINPSDLDLSSKLDVVLEALEEITMRLDEVNEKLANLSLVRDELDFFSEET
jgi:hypothetical protein